MQLAAPQAQAGGAAPQAQATSHLMGGAGARWGRPHHEAPARGRAGGARMIHLHAGGARSSGTRASWWWWCEAGVVVVGRERKGVWRRAAVRA